MKRDITECEHCGNKQETVKPWKHIPQCRECRKPLIAQTEPVAEVPCSAGLVAMQAEAKLFIDANVWDGEDRSGATNDRATFNPDELQELIDDMLEHMSN